MNNDQNGNIAHQQQKSHSNTNTFNMSYFCQVCALHIKSTEGFKKDMQDHCGEQCEDCGEFYILDVDKEKCKDRQRSLPWQVACIFEYIISGWSCK